MNRLPNAQVTNATPQNTSPAATPPQDRHGRVTRDASGRSGAGASIDDAEVRRGGPIAMMSGRGLKLMIATIAGNQEYDHG